MRVRLLLAWALSMAVLTPLACSDAPARYYDEHGSFPEPMWLQHRAEDFAGGLFYALDKRTDICYAYALNSDMPTVSRAPFTWVPRAACEPHEGAVHVHDPK